MSAPPLFRFVDERRVSVVRDVASVRQVLDADPVGSCMVDSRVAEHGVDPSAIGGELWTRGRAAESLCYAGANLIPLRGAAADLYAFADKAVSAARRCSSLVGRAELVLPMWRRLEHTWGPARDVRDRQPLMALATAPHCPIDPAVRPVRMDGPRRLPRRRRRHVHRRGRHRSPHRRRWPRLSAAGRGPDRRRARVGTVRARAGGVQGRGRIAVTRRRPDPGRMGAPRLARSRPRHCGNRDARGRRGAQRPHREPLRQRLQHRGPRHLQPDRVRRSRHLRHRPSWTESLRFTP